MLTLLSVKKSGVFQENDCKQNLVWPCGTSGGKVIFALLKEIIIFHLSLILVDVWELGL